MQDQIPDQSKTEIQQEADRLQLRDCVLKGSILQHLYESDTGDFALNHSQVLRLVNESALPRQEWSDDEIVYRLHRMCWGYPIDVICLPLGVPNGAGFLTYKLSDQAIMEMQAAQIEELLQKVDELEDQVDELRPAVEGQRYE